MKINNVAEKDLSGSIFDYEVFVPYGIDPLESDPELVWLQQLGDPYVASAYDEDGRVGIDWGVYGAPETFLIDKDGVILHKHISPLTEKIWQTDFLPKVLAAKGTSE